VATWAVAPRGLLVLFGLMMFALPTGALGTTGAESGTSPVHAPPTGTHLTLLERERSMSCYEADENGPAGMILTVTYRVGNPHVSEEAVIYLARLRNVRVNLREHYSDALKGAVASPLGGPPIRIPPRTSESVRCCFVLEGTLPQLPTTVSGEATLVDQFGAEHSTTGTVMWASRGAGS